MTVAPPSPSGLPAVDRQWGGLGAGRAYLLVGRAGAGRSALALKTVRAAIETGERCLVISPRPPDELVEVGHGVGLDLAAAHAAGSLRLLRIPKAADLAARGPAGLAKSYSDLVALVASDRPARVVVEDFTPLVQFDTFEHFHDAFEGLVGALREQGVTLVIGLGDPANDASRRLLTVVEGLVDGTIHLDAGGDLILGTPGRAEYPANDGASVEAEPPSAPEGVRAGEPLAPPAPVASAPLEAPAPDTAAQDPFAPSEPTAPGRAGEPPYTDVVAPPPPDPSLLAPSADAFGHDPADALFAQGYLADSRGGTRLSAPPPLPTPTPGPPVPSFAPLGSAAPDPGRSFRAALDASFDGRESGTPFVVVALRVDPEAPDAAHFGTIEAGLRSALRPADRLLVDAQRKRAAVVLPASGPDAAQTIFAGLQDHLRATLGDDTDRVLQAVAAVTVPDGQPFQTSADLVRYAFEG